MSTLRIPGQDFMNNGMQALQQGNLMPVQKNMVQMGQPQQQLPPGSDTQMLQQLLKSILKILESNNQQQNAGEEGDQNNLESLKQGFQPPPQMPMPDVQGQQGQQQAQQPPGTPSGAKSGVPGAPDTIPKPDDKPTDKSKTVDDYLNANNGLLGKLGNQENVKDELKTRYGDWEDKSRSKEDREQSAYNASRHVGSIKNKNNRDGEERSSEITGNGKMEGATKDGDIRDGTEMADLKNSLLGNRSSDEWNKQHKDGKIVVDKAQQNETTESVLKNPNLKQTNDEHVTKDGTNLSNAEYVGHKILQGLSKAFSFLSDIIKNTLGKIPGIGKLFTMAAEFGTKLTSGVLNVADAAVTKGDVKRAGAQLGAGLVNTTIGFADVTGLGGQAAEDKIMETYDKNNNKVKTPPQQQQG